MLPRGAGWSPTRIAVVVAVAVLLSAGLWLPTVGSRAGPPPAGTRSGPVAPLLVSPHLWDNGKVRLVFPNPFPSFSVQSDANGSLASAHVLTGIAEITPSGNTTAFAPFGQSGANWLFASVQNSTATTIWMNATLHVVGASGAWDSPDDLSEGEGGNGTAHIVLTFCLNSSGGPDPASVRFAVNVTRWPWYNTTDTIGFGFVDVAVAGAAIRPGPQANSLAEVRTQDSTTLATLTWAARATVHYRTGGVDNSSVGSFQAIATNGTNSTVHLQFGSVSGGYTDLSFDPWIRLNLSALGVGLALPPVPAWLLTTQSIAILAIVGVACVGLAVVARRSRARDSPPP